MADKRNVNLYLQSRGVPWDHVRVQKVSGREAISELFAFDLEVVCDPGHELPAEALPAADITLVIEIDGTETRQIHGILGPIRDHLDATEAPSSYSLRIVPRASRLALVETQDIYLARSLPDILRSKLERHDLGPDELELRLMEDYPVRDFVVQYRESDLAFVRRLCEHAGISFFFEHDGGTDKLVFTDHPGGFRPAPQAEEIRFRPRGETLDVFSLSLVTDAVPTSFIVQDYNYRTPNVDLSACFDVEEGNGGGIVEYGSHVKTPAEAERLARIRGEERACRRRVYDGKSGLPALYAGGKSTLVEHPRLAASVPLLVVEVQHEVTLAVFSEAMGSTTAASYRNTFRAIPAEVPFRPARLTPKPRIHGFLTGIIQPGSEGETGGVAQIDSEGRYTVQLHFDTAQHGEDKASHAIRMAQPFAGPSYGMHFPLRRGTEVLVAFADGDPDRPVIVGALYNVTSPSPVVAQNATTHQLKASSGALFVFGSKS
jgi:type VI secretion system secreted protein VgrG